MTGLSHACKNVLTCLIHACFLTGLAFFSETFEKNEFRLEVYEISLIAAESFVLLFFRPFLCIATPNPEFLLLRFLVGVFLLMK